MKSLLKRSILLLLIIPLVTATAHSSTSPLQPPLEPLPPYNSQYLHSYIHERGSLMEQGPVDQGSFGEPDADEAKPLPNVTKPAFIVQLSV